MEVEVPRTFDEQDFGRLDGALSPELGESGKLRVV
jgi:hypothetical protein